MEIDLMYELGRWENYIVGASVLATIGALYTAIKFDPKKEKRENLERKVEGRLE